ncbi:hypothetical protein, partial [Gemmatimonas sp.]|uniref:hypothetical protein n=1 Tax=Gemmatimonas sp. TaxID=1962908 RepID=UPI0035686850
MVVEEIRTEGTQLVAVVTIAGHTGFHVRVRLVRKLNGPPAVVELDVVADPEHEVDDKVMKAIRLPAIRRAVIADFTRSAREWVDQAESPAERMRREAGRQATEGLYLAPPTDDRSYLWTDAVLSDFAREAVRVQHEVTTGQVAGTRRHMAEWLRQNVKLDATENTVSEVTFKARKRGFLLPTLPGRRDVQLGPKLGLS